MKESDIILAPVPQADGQIKIRPSLVLRMLPPFGDMLICGISTQLRQQAVNLDEIILPADADFATSGLTTTSLIRLAFLTSIPRRTTRGTIGFIAPERHARLLRRLSGYLVEHLPS